MNKIIIAVAVIIIAVAVVTAYFLMTPKTPSELDDIAKCLTEKGAVMYGTDTCSACMKQKEAFGNSFQYINFVRCDLETQLCESEGIEYFPTWIINNEKYIGVQKILDLMNYAGCGL